MNRKWREIEKLTTYITNDPKIYIREEFLSALKGVKNNYEDHL